MTPAAVLFYCEGDALRPVAGSAGLTGRFSGLVCVGFPRQQCFGVAGKQSGMTNAAASRAEDVGAVIEYDVTGARWKNQLLRRFRRGGASDTQDGSYK